MRRRTIIGLVGWIAVAWPLSIDTKSFASGTIVAQVSPTSTPGQVGLHQYVHIRAKVGKEKRVYGHLRLSKSCVQGPIPDITVITPPKIGALTVRTETVTLTKPEFGNCAPGHSGDGTVVYYKATAAGKDAFEYQMSSPGLPTTTWTVTIEVR